MVVTYERIGLRFAYVFDHMLLVFWSGQDPVLIKQTSPATVCSA